MTRWIFGVLLLVFGGLFTGCGDVGTQLKRKPHAFGKAGNLYVLADTTTMNQRVADTLDHYFGAAFPILPQPEPLFDIRHYTFIDLVQESAKQHLRSYLVLANMADKNAHITQMVMKDIGEETIRSGLDEAPYIIKIGHDKWAVNQLLVYIIGRDEQALIDGIKAAVAPLTKRLYAFDGEQYEVNLFHGGKDLPIQQKIKEWYAVELDVPERFAIGVQKKPFLWLQDYIPDVTGGVLFYKTDYLDQSAFSREAMIALRDSLTREHISGPTDNSYMRVDTLSLPTFHYITEVDGQYASELRGYWVMEGDFMAGAFISYLIKYPDSDEVLFIDAFVYGPGEAKREPMKQLDYLIRKVRF